MERLSYDVLAILTLQLHSTRDIASLLSSCHTFDSLRGDPNLLAAWLVRWHPGRALLVAAERGLAPVVQGILRKGRCQANSAEAVQEALHCACAAGHAEVVSELLASSKSHPPRPTSTGQPIRARISGSCLPEVSELLPSAHQTQGTGGAVGGRGGGGVEGVGGAAGAGRGAGAGGVGGKGGVELAAAGCTGGPMAVDVNARCRHTSCTPLQAACMNEHAEVVKRLLKVPGIEVNVQRQPDNSNPSPLLAACLSSHLELVRLLLAHPSTDPNAGCGLPSPPFHTVISVALAAIFKERHQQQLQQQQQHQLQQQHQQHSQQHQQQGQHERSWDVLDAFLKHPKFDINTRDDQGRAAIHFLTASNDIPLDPRIQDLGLDLRADLRLFRAMLAVPGLDVNARDGRLWTPLHVLACSGARVLQTDKPSSRQGGTELAGYAWAAGRLSADARRSGAALTAADVMLDLLLMDPRVKAAERTLYGSTPLHLAAKAGCRGAVVRLLRLPASEGQESGAGARGRAASWACPPDAVDEDGETALHKACRAGHADVVLELLGNGQRPSQETGKGGQIESLQGLPVAATATRVNCRSVSDSGRTPLHLACSEGHLSTVEALLGDTRVRLEDVDTASGCTALLLAAAEGHVRVARALLLPRAHLRSWDAAAAANVNARDARGLTALHYSCNKGHKGLVALMLSVPTVTVNAADFWGETALHKACTRGYAEIIQLLTAFPGLDANASDDVGCTPLHIASQRGHAASVRALLAAPGSDPAVVDSAGGTPLHRVCLLGNLECTQLLLQRLVGRLPLPDGAALTAADDCGLSPLHLACAGGHQNLVHALLQSITTTAALTASTAGSSCGNSSVCRAVNQRDRHGRTPLHLACAGGHVSVVELLVEVPGAFLQATDVEGLTPAQHAVQQNRAVVYSHGGSDAALRMGGPGTPSETLTARAARGQAILEILSMSKYDG